MGSRIDTNGNVSVEAPDKELEIDPSVGEPQLPIGTPADEAPIDLEKEFGGGEAPPEKETPNLDALEENDDATPEFQSQREEMEAAAAGDTLEQMFGGEETIAAPGEAPAPTAPPKEGRGAAMDLWEGAIETPRAVVSGTREALQSTINLGAELEEWVRDNVGDGKSQPAFLRNVKLPDVDKPDTVTGQVVAGITQFLVGMAGAGKILKPLQVAGKLAKGAKAVAQSGLADFAAFDGHEKRFSNMLQEWTKDYPELSSAVGALAAKPDDSALEGRVKNVLEGLGLNAVTEGLIKATKFIGQSKALKEGAGKVINAVDGAPVPRDVPKNLLGDPEAGFFIKEATEKLEEGVAATKDLKPSQVTGKPLKDAPVMINFARIKAPEDIKTVIKKMAQRGKEGIDEATRGKRTWKQTKLSAEQEDAWKLVLERRQGQPFNAEESVAARELWVSSGTKVKELAALAKDSKDPSVLVQFRQMLATHYAIQKEVIAARTETARALQAWQIPVGKNDGTMDQLSKLLEQNGGAIVAQDIAEKIAKLGDAGMEKELDKFVEGTVFANGRNAVAQVWINGLLSNPATHMANHMSNTAVAVMQVGERKAAEYLSQKLGTQSGVEVGEALAMAHGLIEGFKDGAVKKLKDWKMNPFSSRLKEMPKPSEAGGMPIKADSSPVGALSADAWKIANDTMLGRSLNVLDSISQTPGKMLQGADEFYKGIGYRMELRAQAVRMASQELRGGLIDPTAFKKRVAEIVENPPENVHIEATNAATYQTFQGTPAKTLKDIGDAIQRVPVLGRLLLPFKNTPINILTYTFERTPLAPLVKSFRADIAAGGARADIAMARMSTGTMTLAAFSDLAMTGTMTGRGPSEPSQRAQWLRAGNQPYSIKMGNKWVSYNRVDPVGFTMGLAADIADATLNAQAEIGQEDFAELMAVTSFAISSNVLSKTYMKGVAEIMAAVTSPDMKGFTYAQKVLASGIPAGAGAVTRMTDPYLRTAEHMTDVLRRKIPGLSDELPLYRDLWGRTVDYRSGMGAVYDLVMPVYLKKIDPEPVDKELSRLEYYPDMPNKKNYFNGVDIELDGKQYEKFVRLAGNELKHPAWNMGMKDFLNAVVSGDRKKSMGMSEVYKIKSDGPDGAKAEFIKKTINQYRDLAKKKLMEEDKGLAAQIDLKKKQKPGKLMPELMGR